MQCRAKAAEIRPNVRRAQVAKSRPCVAALSAATPNFKHTPDAAKVKLLLDGRRVQHDDDDDLGADGWGGCFGGSAAGCF